ncbi:hypothetical protein BC940DRAFT_317944 [Gongronella butleri]|nr:hypothetical protein BC940DRAFT_317944 [Gongronella butleri]
MEEETVNLTMMWEARLSHWVEEMMGHVSNGDDAKVQEAMEKYNDSNGKVMFLEQMVTIKTRRDAMSCLRVLNMATKTQHDTIGKAVVILTVTCHDLYGDTVELLRRIGQACPLLVQMSVALGINAPFNLGLLYCANTGGAASWKPTHDYDDPLARLVQAVPLKGLALHGPLDITKFLSSTTSNLHRLTILEFPQAAVPMDLFYKLPMRMPLLTRLRCYVQCASGDVSDDDAVLRALIARAEQYRSPANNKPIWAQMTSLSIHVLVDAVEALFILLSLVYMAPNTASLAFSADTRIMPVEKGGTYLPPMDASSVKCELTSHDLQWTNGRVRKVPKDKLKQLVLSHPPPHFGKLTKITFGGLPLSKYVKSLVFRKLSEVKLLQLGCAPPGDDWTPSNAVLARLAHTPKLKSLSLINRVPTGHDLPVSFMLQSAGVQLTSLVLFGRFQVSIQAVLAHCPRLTTLMLVVVNVTMNKVVNCSTIKPSSHPLTNLQLTTEANVPQNAFSTVSKWCKSLQSMTVNARLLVGGHDEAVRAVSKLKLSSHGHSDMAGIHRWIKDNYAKSTWINLLSTNSRECAIINPRVADKSTLPCETYATVEEVIHMELKSQTGTFLVRCNRNGMDPLNMSTLSELIQHLDAYTSRDPRNLMFVVCSNIEAISTRFVEFPFAQ